MCSTSTHYPKLQSDDSLEHLSAEEKACLMFLEETIESLDTEDDSGLSNDEADQLPSPGNLATKLANLSASMSKSTFNVSQKPALKEPIKKNGDTKPLQSYLVPTPLVVASSPPCCVSSSKEPGIPRESNPCSKIQSIPSDNKLDQKHSKNPVAPLEPLEVNVVKSSCIKPRGYSVRAAEFPLPRGPLSYDGLVHLRRSASTKKTPLCPTVDHTINLDKHFPAIMEGPNLSHLPRSNRSHSEASRSKTGPPVVAPKPQNIPANICMKTHNETPITSDSSYSVKHATDPKVVRLEALQKLGLLKDQEPENEMINQLSLPKSHSSLDPTPNRGLSNGNPTRSVSFHHYSKHNQQPASVSHPAQTKGLTAAGLQRSSTLDNHRIAGNFPEPRCIKAVEQVKTCTTPQSISCSPSNIIGYTAMVVPGMGADRKEALRKLGLLKN
ncbi:specifically androgen-regulated gene protein isoform X2 [Mastacembelus armatus]|uniref:specifically androgen-regulated gene protein isoform X2 n=1 Tax=Mastacembelus armatus TaxID=205130 RepID=UPI000E456A2C|nr:specifically androgen-regulated gene protein-like isoform X2 [Mastacembelus armatus]